MKNCFNSLYSSVNSPLVSKNVNESEINTTNVFESDCIMLKTSDNTISDKILKLFTKFDFELFFAAKMPYMISSTRQIAIKIPKHAIFIPLF